MRDKWEFEYSAEVLRDHARRKRDYHERRGDWWAQQRELADDRIRSGGIELRHQPATGGGRTDVILDPALAERLRECERKIAEHRAKAEEYANWASLMEWWAPENRLYPLDAQDVRYFGLHTPDHVDPDIEGDGE